MESTPRSPRPDLEQLRQVAQSTEVLSRRNAEHWVSLVYARRVSLRLTRILIPTRITANSVTYAMVVVGLLAGALLLIEGVLGALLAALAIQLYLILDCSDGELARWRGTTSLKGAYLDRLGHYVVEVNLFVFFGLRVGGSVDSGWFTLGLATALLAALAKIETDLVAATVGPQETKTDEVTVTPIKPLVRRLRSLTHPLKIHRITGAVEASLVILAVAIVELLIWSQAEQALLLLFITVAAALFVGHGVSILSSSRLRGSQ